MAHYPLSRNSHICPSTITLHCSQWTPQNHKHDNLLFGSDMIQHYQSPTPHPQPFSWSLAIIPCKSKLFETSLTHQIVSSHNQPTVNTFYAQIMMTHHQGLTNYHHECSHITTDTPHQPATTS